MNENQYWLWLSMVFGVENYQVWRVMRFFETAQEAYVELKSGFDKVSFKEKELENIKTIDIIQALNLMEQIQKQGINICGYNSEKYPPLLRYIKNPPAVLYYKGNIDCLINKNTVTTVGTRKASDYGLFITKKICRELALRDITIVSGFALGIDVTSQLGAIEVNRPTVSVMGCGLDINYPKGNFKYRDMVIESGGAFVSEYPLGTLAFARNFPFRNRILAGLGKIAIVFEAPQKSGSLITADYASEQGKDVFCIPPSNIFSEKYSGNVQLLSEGAIPLFSSEDIIDYFKTDEKDNELSPHNDLKPKIVKEKVSFVKKELATFEKQEVTKSEVLNTSKNDVEVNNINDNLNDVQKKICNMLDNCSVHFDVIARKLNVSAEDLMFELTELEMEGIVIQLPGNMFKLKDN